MQLRAIHLAAAVMTLAIAMPLAAASKKNLKVAPTAPTPPVMQLGDAVKPLAYEAELTIVPTQERFTGHLVIHVEVAKPTEFFWLNAKRLDIRGASLVANGKSYPAKTVAGGQEFVGLRFASLVPAGRAVITLDYDGVIDRTQTAGIFKLQDGDSWYAFTQFEATDARRAFPCFDEPQWKTPWHLSLIVPAADIAASNMPIASEEPVIAAPGKEAPARKGASSTIATPSNAPVVTMKRVRFAPTPPLPSYLVAFAVGPFDIVDGTRAGKKGTPLRYLVPKGRAGEAAYAKEVTPKLLELLEDYFGQPYPFEKLDAVAIPIARGFGAMENVGLITYAMPLLLASPEQDSETRKRDYAEAAAHEIAHQWFGDLVTMQWWNDLWLSESFATWMAPKIVDRFYPAWQLRLAGDERRQKAIVVDRLATTRQLRQPVNSLDDLGNAFDAISYEKGAAVLAMFENAIGEERFRNGVRRYLYEHAQGNARSEDFVRAMAAEAGPENAATIAGLKSFIEQPGVPRLAVSLDCGPDGRALPKLIVAQSRYLPSKQTGEQSREQSTLQRWTFPACFQFGRGGDFNESCALIQEARTAVPLPAGERCPQWVLSNRGGNGYFVSSLTTELTQQLAHTPLLPSEAIPALHDAATLTASGEWPADLALEFAARFANHRQLPVAEAAADLAAVVRPSWLADANEREGFARYVQKNFGARAHALGWTVKAADRDGDAIARRTLVPWVADMGNDGGLQKDASRMAREWLASKAPFPSGARAALQSAARSAQGQPGRELLDALLDALDRVTSGDRRSVLAALGSFRDEALADAAYDALLSDRFGARADAREAVAAMWLGAADDEVGALLAIRYLRAHYDAVVGRLPEPEVASLPRLGTALCDPAAKAEYEAAFGDKAARVPGGARNDAQAAEVIGICIAARQSQSAALKAWLPKQ